LTKEVLVNDRNICVGTKDDQFGEFQIPQTGVIVTFKLIYKSGGVSNLNSNSTKDNWGTNLGKRDIFQIFVTLVNGTRVAPPNDYKKWVRKMTAYKIDNQYNNDAEIRLPDTSTPRYAYNGGTKFRIWFGEDLIGGQNEMDNVGETCMDIKVIYRDM
ncbi:hypothetical protein AC249_AIPGENE293, partial [Exaiptasia diaphana]